MKATLAVTGLVLIGLVVGWYYLAMKKPEVAQPTGGQVTTEKYESGTHGVSFSYPSTYAVEERDLEINGTNGHFIPLMRKADVVPANGEGGTAMTVAIFNNRQNVPLADFLQNLKSLTPEPTTGWDYTEASVAGKEGIAYSGTGLYESDNVAVAGTGKVYLFSTSWLTREDQILKDFDALLKSVQLTNE